LGLREWKFGSETWRRFERSGAFVWIFDPRQILVASSGLCYSAPALKRAQTNHGYQWRELAKMGRESFLDFHNLHRV
jgi:hypothetical protein